MESSRTHPYYDGGKGPGVMILEGSSVCVRTPLVSTVFLTNSNLEMVGGLCVFQYLSVYLTCVGTTCYPNPSYRSLHILSRQRVEREDEVGGGGKSEERLSDGHFRSLKTPRRPTPLPMSRLQSTVTCILINLPVESNPEVYEEVDHQSCSTSIR